MVKMFPCSSGKCLCLSPVAMTYSNMFQTLHIAIAFVKLCRMKFIIQPLIKDAQELF